MNQLHPIFSRVLAAFGMPQRERDRDPSEAELTDTMLQMTPDQISAFPWQGADDEVTSYLTKLWRETRTGDSQ